MTLRGATGWLAAGLLLAACSDDGPPAPDSTGISHGGALDTAPVVAALVPREILFDGVVEAVNESTVAAQTGGRVLELPFDVGDFVAKGELIARLTDTEQRARVEAARGAVAEARARLAEARLAYDRTKDIFDRQLVSRAELDRATAELDSARARLESAQANLDEAEENLSYTVIRAPYAGTVVERHVRLGETVAPGTPLMTGLSLEHLRVIVEIPQQHIGPLRRHQQARILLPDGSSVAADDLRIPPRADAGTHTFRVLVTLPQGDHHVFPGTLAKVAFVRGEQERVLIPGEALVRRGELTAAYVVDDAGRVTLRYLRTATPTMDGRVPILAGLTVGERVAVDPIAAGIAYKQQGVAAAENTP
ncbi:MAG: efflux RND transporter periplasmic adaptor subunit [Gammaproteobacteria bacterium]|nr:efflux RND transporter periplasmic adaptor subunit [Gammaproteobacteria bacterium]